MSGLLAILLAGSFSGLADSPVLPRPPLDPRCKVLDDALRDGRGLALLKREIAQLSLGGIELQDDVLRWIGRNKAELGDEGAAELEDVLIEMNPRSNYARDVRERRIRDAFNRSSFREKAPVYRQAVEMGAARIGEGVEIGRWFALCSASLEGLEEFAGLLEKHSGEVDALMPRQRVPYSKQMALQMTLRAGAIDRYDATNRAAEHIARAVEENAAEEPDEALRLVSRSVALEACEIPKSASCARLRTALKSAALGAAGARGTVRTDWIRSLRGITDGTALNP